MALKRRKKNKSLRKKGKTNLKEIINNKKNIKVYKCKKDYFISNDPRKRLFIKNLNYNCIKINENFYCIISSNGKTVYITTDLFNKVFI